jgi:hypothetical protein
MRLLGDRRLLSVVAVFILVTLALVRVASGGGTADAVAAETPEPPRVVTAPAEKIRFTQAELVGSVNPHGSPGTYYFAWGAAYTSLSNTTPVMSAGKGTHSETFRQTITGLQPGHEYFFQIVATNGGGTTKGSIGHLVTLKDTTPPVIELSGPLTEGLKEGITEYPLHVHTTDGNAGKLQSGVKSVSIAVDGTVVKSAEQPCPEGNCELNLDWTYETSKFPGTHTVTVAATDQVGNASSQQLTPGSPEAFTCEPETPDEPEFEEPEEAEEADLVSEASVCPSGEQKEPLGWEGPNSVPNHELPERGPAAAVFGPVEPFAVGGSYYRTGYYKAFSGHYKGGEGIEGEPTEVAVGRFTIEKPTLHPGLADENSVNHSLAEMAVQQSQADGTENTIEVGWIVNRVEDISYNEKGKEERKVRPGPLQPHLFTFFWTNGNPHSYNSPRCYPFGRKSNRVPKGAEVKPGGGPRRFAVRHDAAKHRWEVYYAGRPMCAYNDSLWEGNFTSARSVQWFGEVTAYANGKFCEQMGNGILGTKSGAAQIDGMAGSAGSGPGLQFEPLEEKPSDENYAESREGDDARYGGPGDSC